MNSLHLAHAKDFEQIYAIMEASFPPDERRTYAAQRALMDRPNYRVYMLPGNGGIAAFISLWQFEDFAFIEHLATCEACRNQGLGAEILRQIKGLLPCPLCLEAELPETEIAIRRLAFYERNGFCANDYPYIQPPYGEDKSPVPLVFLTSGCTVSQARFETMKAAINREVYGVL